MARPEESSIELSPGVWNDLGLSTIVTFFTSNLDHQREIAGLVANMCQDPEDILYRQDEIEDLLNQPCLLSRGWYAQWSKRDITQLQSGKTPAVGTELRQRNCRALRDQLPAAR
jgi:hypothetical protein